MSNDTQPDDRKDLTEIVVGRHPVLEVLNDPAIPVDRILLQVQLSGAWVDDLRRTARQSRVPVQFVPRTRLDRLARGAAHQGVAAYIASVSYLVLEDLLQEVAPHLEAVRSLKPILLMLDQIQDPRNFGAILRSALASGVAGVIVPDRGMAPLSTVALKASAGAGFRLPIARTVNLVLAIDQLKERGYWVVGADGHAELSHWDYDWDRPMAIVIGGEGSGIRPAVAARCDTLVAIPLIGGMESLNASVAASILCYEAARARYASLS